MRMGLRCALGALVVALALAGCTGAPTAPQSPTPSPTPSPTYFCTPTPAATPAEDGTPTPEATPTPCSPEQYSEEVRLNLLYEEATKNYRRFFEENVKLLRAGGADKATPNLLAVAGGPYLEATVTNLRQFRELGVKAGPGEITLVRLDRTSAPDAEARGYEVALATCIDSRDVALVQDSTELRQGFLYAETVYFKRDAGILKLWDAEGGPVESC